MKISTITILAAALGAAPTTFAQQSTEPLQAPAPAAAPVSDGDLETFAAIYADLIETAAKFQAELDAAQTEQQALDISDRAEAESIEKVVQRGWTPERFARVSDAIKADPALTERAVRLIEAR